LPDRACWGIHVACFRKSPKKRGRIFPPLESRVVLWSNWLRNRRRAKRQPCVGADRAVVLVVGHVADPRRKRLGHRRSVVLC